jgi:hypothetical protein
MQFGEPRRVIEQEQIKSGIKALEAQRGLLGGGQVFKRSIWNWVMSQA